jgi:L-ascorbate metabolism protein UlaG (beta-lactamase superfamily)
MRMLQRAKRVGKKFQNPVPTVVGGLSIMLKVFPLYVKSMREGGKVPEVAPGPFRTDARVYGTAAKSGLRVTWFGHSASLVEMDGFRVLIDPVWDERAAPVQWFGPKRFFPPTIGLRDLPVVDVVLISHDHYDHLGKGTIQQLAGLPGWRGVRWVTSVGVGKILRGFGVAGERITELDWTETATIVGDLGREMTVTAVPSRHFSGRSLSNRNETLWGAFVLKGTRHTVYYGADTGWWDGFGEIAAEYGPFDLTMLEIGAYHPLWGDIHLGPDNALRAFEAIGAKGLLMPVHWGLFDLALHPWKQPIERMTEIAGERGVKLWSPEPGEPTEVVAGEGFVREWWRS